MSPALENIGEPIALWWVESPLHLSQSNRQGLGLGQGNYYHHMGVEHRRYISCQHEDIANKYAKNYKLVHFRFFYFDVIIWGYESKCLKQKKLQNMATLEEFPLFSSRGCCKPVSSLCYLEIHDVLSLTCEVRLLAEKTRAFSGPHTHHLFQTCIWFSHVSPSVKMGRPPTGWIVTQPWIPFDERYNTMLSEVTGVFISTSAAAGPTSLCVCTSACWWLFSEPKPIFSQRLFFGGLGWAWPRVAIICYALLKSEKKQAGTHHQFSVFTTCHRHEWPTDYWTKASCKKGVTKLCLKKISNWQRFSP